jgi:predicted nucleic acid-binding protein
LAQPIAVTNTSPVIALVGIGELRLLDALFERIVVPFEVWDELTDKAGAPEPPELLGLRRVGFHPPLPLSPESAGLDPGERAAITVAASLPGAWILLDEIAARKVAAALGLQVRGTLGILAEAKRQGLVPAVRPLIQKMIENGCRLAPELVAAVASAAGET